MKYIDLHCDTLAKAWMQKKDTMTHLEHTMVDIEKMQKSGASAQFFAMFLPQKQGAEWRDLKETEDLAELMERMYAIYRNTLRECSSVLAPAYGYEDLLRNQKEGKISSFLTMENGVLADGKIENIRRFYEMGVRLITLTWNDPNCLGFPHSPDPAQMRRGLTPFGREAVAFMEELGILVDVSHLSDAGFYDTADILKKPFVASHSNCRALCGATRNLTDDMIRVLAEHGGVAGINFEPTFLEENGTVSRVERMCDHVEHLIQCGGVECVGIGTDFDGIEGNFEISDCTKIELLFNALHRRGMGEDTIEKIAYTNTARVIRDVMKAVNE